MTNGPIRNWFRGRPNRPLEVGGVAFLRVTPADWVASGILTPYTPLRIERVAQSFATVSRVDGCGFAFAAGNMPRMVVPVSCLTRKADYPH